MSLEKCIEVYLKARMPGLYYALALVARISYGAELATLLLCDRWKAFNVIKKLCSEEAAELLLKLIEEECLRTKRAGKGGGSARAG
ncbi:MAG: hypothetical protein QXW94_01920 [Desulfurococcaceae archaeon]